ncbi:MAG TPA: GNAT family N-acetyltransferase [Symbiobacteriaceae bacterium]|nr:GNAT family N-acetyltransferase [Symbiobacteriaceae bacterium]
MAWQVRPYQMTEISPLMERSLQTAGAQLMEREARRASAAQLATQVQRMFAQTLGAQGGTCLVATNGSAIGGYVLLMPTPNPFTGAQEGVVMDIWVDPGLRGNGMARLLLSATEEWGSSVGVTGLAAQVAVHNQASLRAFLKAGYQVERYVLGKEAH